MNDYLIQNFGKNVAQLRKKKGVTQAELAEVIGVKKAAISKIELGTSYPTFANLDKIARYFKATPNELFGTSTDIELERAVIKTDEYSEKAEKIIRAVSKIEEYSEKAEQILYALERVDELERADSSQTYSNEIIHILDRLTYAPIMETDKGDPLYRDDFGHLTTDPSEGIKYARHLSQLQLLFNQADKIKEIADDVNFILEHQDILKDK
ncbi:helix-turn-helix domain-containing protein [Streptococcus orisratti]|uniref:HTH-type transcriptional regulator n=1 Tax=Streptococcus ferus TaxID=1345 RepID=A0A2X3W0E8_9STRE|nr:MULTISPECIES: helix-turn-helix transcriptional regulator [Streptococcus]SQF39097.1 HTH-type transcriptional regulator [Streptococcus ferus]